MKKILFSAFIAGFFVFAVSCGSRHNITAEIEGAGSVIRVYAEDSNGNKQTDTIRAKKGKFIYDIPESISEPAFVSLVLTTDIYPALENGSSNPSSKNINLIISRDDRIEIKAEKMLDTVICTIKSSAPDAGLTAARKKYIRENPDRELSAYYAATYIELDSMEYYMSLINTLEIEGFLKKYIENKRQYLSKYLEHKKIKETIIEGADAPAFTLADRDGNTVSLADIKADYIVLDFWGSWCGYCIAGFPKMKEYYAKYAGKVEFVGIDCRDSHEKWIAALDKYELPWMQLFDNTDDKTAVRYAVEGYPTKILIGPDRKIAAVYLGEVDEFYEKLDELFK